jgi:hypothetical protein
MIHSSPATPVRRPQLFDGYVRLSFDELLQLDFNQKSIWEDQGLLEDLVEEDVHASKAGYCEWATRLDGQNISIGWAWFEARDSRVCLAPGGLSSNLMLITPKRYDLGMQKTFALLQSWLEGVDWRPRLVHSTNGALHKFGSTAN